MGGRGDEEPLHSSTRSPYATSRRVRGSPPSLPGDAVYASDPNNNTSGDGWTDGAGWVDNCLKGE